VFPGGTEIGLEINCALRDCKEVQLFSAGLGIPNHAPYVYAQHFELPRIEAPGWLEALNDLVSRLSIRYVFPAYDDVLVALAGNSERINAKIVTSPLETCIVTRSKGQTYRRLRDVVPVPKVYEMLDSVDRYPVFVKPDSGQGSQNTHLAHDRCELALTLRQVPKPLILEYVPGDEYTIDCFSDREQGILFCGARLRERVRSGISVGTSPVASGEFEGYARAISSVLEFHGAWFFQMKRDEQGSLKLLEIAPRIAGAMALHRAMGVNFPLLSIYEQERLPIRVMTNALQISLDRALVNRYRHNLHYDVVYVDLDDTLIVRGRVNPRLIAFLYQCINNHKRLVLLTRHAENTEQTLRSHRLLGVFDQVVCVPPRPACKSEFVTESNAILIDDSFSERCAISTKLGIPTFDCSMLEMLLDHRA
jgi:hypothetical protein